MPPACAVTRWPGWASTRPAASTRSLIEKVCESFLTWTCTGNASLIAKAAAQSTHGRFRAVGAPGSGRTTMTNSATATAASAVVISMIRWGTLSRNARGAVPGAPFVIVVTSLWGQNRQAQSEPDQVTPDHVTPDQVTPDQVTPDHVTPDQVTPDQVTPDHVTPDQVTPDHVTPDQVTPDQVTPDQVTPDQVTPDRLGSAAGESAGAGAAAGSPLVSVAAASLVAATSVVMVSALLWSMSVPVTSTSPV